MNLSSTESVGASKSSLKSKGWLIPIAILVISGLAAFGIQTKHESDISASKRSYIATEHTNSIGSAKQVEGRMNLLYQGLRTIARLPGVRSIDRYAKKFDDNAKSAVQEIYNNLGSNISMSEVYIVPVGLEPDKIDPVTHKNQEPIITFDKLILNKDAGSAEKPEEKSKIPEIEIYEYRLMKQQLRWFAKVAPTEKKVSGLEFPAYSGPQVVTCDNSRYHPEKPNDQDRSGLVYSVPYFAPDGRLKGCISGVMLTSVLAELLPTTGFSIANPTTAFQAVPAKAGPSADQAWLTKNAIPKDLVYAETVPIKLADGAGQWKLFCARPASEFWSSASVKAADSLATGSALLLGLLTLGSLAGWYMIQQNQKSILKRNQELEANVAARTADLDQSNRHLEQQLEQVRKIGERVTSSVTALGTTSEGLREVVANTRRGVQEVSSAVTESSRAAEESLMTSENLVGAMHALAQSSETGLASVQVMTTEVDQVRAAALAQAKIVDETTSAFSNLQETISDLNASMKSVRDQTDKTTVTLNQLGELGKQIGSIVSMIDAIAVQTNLLALNAAIEAARAGESGRGFAVVADEVRKLAEGTSDSTAKVSALVQAVRSSLEEAEGSMRITERTVRETEAKSQSASGEIESAVVSLVQIRESAQSNVKALDTITKTIMEVRSLSEGNAAVSEETTAALMQLNHMAQTVAESSRRASLEGEKQTLAAELLGEAENRLYAIIGDLKEAANSDSDKIAA